MLILVYYSLTHLPVHWIKYTSKNNNIKLPLGDPARIYLVKFYCFRELSDVNMVLQLEWKYNPSMIFHAFLLSCKYPLDRSWACYNMLFLSPMLCMVFLLFHVNSINVLKLQKYLKFLTPK